MPDGTNKFELIITYLEGGLMSEYLFNDLPKIGDEFIYRGKWEYLLYQKT